MVKKMTNDDEIGWADWFKIRKCGSLHESSPNQSKVFPAMPEPKGINGDAKSLGKASTTRSCDCKDRTTNQLFGTVQATGCQTVF